MAAFGLWEILGVALSGAAAFGVGAVWYGALGARWMKAVGKTKAQLQASPSPAPFIIAFAGAVLSSGVMAALMGLAGLSGPVQGLALGAALGALVAAPWLLLHYAFADRPADLWWIDGVHTALSLTIAGLVLGLFL